MSADPEAPADPSRVSGGHIVRNMIYAHDENHNLAILSGWSEQGTREYDQETVRPASANMNTGHPCFSLNQELLRCSYSCPTEMKLGGRTATCNTERQVLMRCLVKNKQWKPDETKRRPLYRFW
ncbi:conserved hypothetical protein [Leishmania mexicana MHOM/GT/2001/U1103]|uniref:Uncharacterized protein n=1 Tax=Leishmania mexicana (strain MHOM/GT/2001/U1103) TaxID=929439 RepID=E9B1V8_LEIMU|nr:conserved hypothetical protein [Leishmania mexicana MHOM/GT/2001/U1103]CBZ29215.1 conserved hypothetical protein [Leishmania mexicana MHOM/GT/2001/U1103]